MNLNPPRAIRGLIYAANVLGAPFVAYAFAKGWIGELEVSLFGAEVTAAFLLAGLNTGSIPERNEGGYLALGDDEDPEPDPDDEPTPPARPYEEGH